MILAIDIGNTNIVLGAVTDGNIDFMARISTDKLKTEDEYGAQILRYNFFCSTSCFKLY